MTFCIGWPYRAKGRSRDRWQEIEEQASSLLWFHPLVIPGLLQTPAYAREIFEKSGRPIDNIEDYVQARMERQKIIAPENSMTFIAVIDEGVLYRPIGGAEVMREKILKLLEIAEHPNIRIQIAKIPKKSRSLSGYG